MLSAKHRPRLLLLMIYVIREIFKRGHILAREGRRRVVVVTD